MKLNIELWPDQRGSRLKEFGYQAQFREASDKTACLFTLVHDAASMMNKPDATAKNVIESACVIEQMNGTYGNNGDKVSN